ncbi:MAG: cellulase family glycosylhydrolase [Myxococcota bacterium]
MNLRQLWLLFGLISCAPPASAAAGWLHTAGNRIYTENNEVWVGVGANLHDTRGCNACTWGPPNVSEVKRRVDELVDVWGANFIRLDLESYGASSVLNDASYLRDVVDIVDHIGTKAGVHVLLSLWIDPSFTDLGWPTAGTRDVWRKLAETFHDRSHVMYGLVNEPEDNYDGSMNAAVWSAMNDTVLAIRDVETSLQSPAHIIAVQGVGGWSRFLGYYVNRPITAGNGVNIAYEVHVYDPQSTFAERFINPSATLPVIIGEYGPAHGMSMNDCAVLMQSAWERKIPTLAWTFHMRCPPNLIVDNSGGSCGIGMNLVPTSWGQLLKDHLASVRGQFVGMTHSDGTPPPPPPSSTPTAPTGPPPPMIEVPYDPSFRLSPNNNEWWIEVTADAEEVIAEREDGTTINLPATSWGSFAANTYLPSGTVLRLRFRLQSMLAVSTWFPFLEGAPSLADAGSSPPALTPTEPSPTPPPAPTTGDESAGWEFSVGPNSNEWWVEVYSNAVDVEVEQSDGSRRSLQPTAWGSFAAGFRLSTGTPVRFHLSSSTATIATPWFPWLTADAPSIEAGDEVEPAVAPALRTATNATPWRPAFISDADHMTGEILSTGASFGFQRRDDRFLSRKRPIAQGTLLRLTVEKNGETWSTAPFRYLDEEPVLR